MRHLDASEIPEGWSLVTLGDAAEKILGGGTPPKANKDNYEGDIPWVTVKDLKSMFITDALDHITEEAISKSASNLIPAGNVILATRMAVGSAHLNTVDVAINQDLKAIFPKRDVSAKYLTYWLRTHSQMLASLGAGSTVKGLGLSQVRQLPFPKPPIAEQNAVVDILSSIDEALAASKAVLEQLKIIKSTLIHQFFNRDSGDMERALYFHPKLGWIPKTWKVKRLEEVADIERGKFAHRPRNDPNFYGGEYPFIQTGDVVKSNGSINTFTQTLNRKGFEVSREFAAGTIVMTIAANIGGTAILQFPACFPDSLVGITPKDEVLGTFLYYYLMTLKNYLIRLAPESAQKNINLQVLRPLLIPLPSIDEQRIMLNTLSSLDQRINLENRNIVQMGKVKQGLLSQLLTGKLRVAVDDG